MIKSQREMLCNLKSLHLSVMAQSPTLEFLRGHTLALLCVAQQWDMSGEFLQYVKQHPILDDQPFILLERVEK